MRPPFAFKVSERPLSSRPFLKRKLLTHSCADFAFLEAGAAFAMASALFHKFCSFLKALFAKESEVLRRTEKSLSCQLAAVFFLQQRHILSKPCQQALLSKTPLFLCCPHLCTKTTAHIEHSYKLHSTAAIMPPKKSKNANKNGKKQDQAQDNTPKPIDQASIETLIAAGEVEEAENPPPQPSSQAVRQNMVDRIQDDGSNSIMNPSQIPPIPGEWRWLEAADAYRAFDQGYNTPIDVTRARAEGHLGHGFGPDNPSVRFTPDARLFNPEEQPDIEGHWEFFTTGDGSAQTWAWTQVGGQDAYGFLNVPYPTAEQVWDLRQRLIREGESLDVLDGIDLVWVPHADIPPVPREASATSSAPASPTQSAVQPGGDDHSEVDPKDIENALRDEDPPHLWHDLTNGGENDQTGHPERRWYRTVMIKGKKYTLDVGPAIRDSPEPHKFYVPNEKGVWRKYLRADNMDWSLKDHIEHLNSWRDQNMARGPWPPKRKPRPDYTPEQKRWLFEYVKANGGKAPGSKALEDLAAEFNRRWSQDRNRSAMPSICARLANIYKENDGKFVLKEERGAWKKREAERKRKEREEEEAKQGDSKRRKSGRQTKPTKKADESKDAVDGDETNDDNDDNDHDPNISDIDGSENGEGDTEFDAKDGEKSDGEEGAEGDEAKEA